jgi:predicted ATPase
MPVRVVNPEEFILPVSPARSTPHDGISGNFPYAYLDLPIVGRDTELTQVMDALNAQTRVTLIRGFGGMGKTRLAAEVVDKLKASFADGVIWHAISASSTLSKLTEDIRDHLGMDNLSQEDTIWAAMSRKAVLLVLDNAEDCHERKAYADRVHAVDLRGGTRILMTSRSLWTELEHVKEVEIGRLEPPAAVTMLKALVDAEPKGHSPAGYEDQLVSAAHFHPRLIWYAVKWLNGCPVQHVLTILTTLKGDDAEQALQDVVHKTVELVKEQPGGPAAIDALRRLTVTRGGFTFEAALALIEALTPGPSPSGRGESNPAPLHTDTSAVVGAGGEVDSPRKLALLKQWGLATLEGQRYQIDPLVIAAVGEDDSAHRPHYDFYKALANEHDKKQDYLGLDPESANLEAAFEWAMAAGAYADAFWFYNACAFFLANRGRFVHSMDWLERVAARLSDHADEYVKAAVQNSLGILYREHPLGERRANLKRAIAAFEAAPVYYTPQSAPLAYAMTQRNMGITHEDLGNLPAALACWREAERYYRQMGHVEEADKMLRWIGDAEGP